MLNFTVIIPWLYLLIYANSVLLPPMLYIVTINFLIYSFTVSMISDKWGYFYMILPAYVHLFRKKFFFQDSPFSFRIFSTLYICWYIYSCGKGLFCLIVYHYYSKKVLLNFPESFNRNFWFWKMLIKETNSNFLEMCGEKLYASELYRIFCDARFFGEDIALNNYEIQKSLLKVLSTDSDSNDLILFLKRLKNNYFFDFPNYDHIRMANAPKISKLNFFKVYREGIAPPSRSLIEHLPLEFYRQIKLQDVRGIRRLGFEIIVKNYFLENLIKVYKLLRKAKDSLGTRALLIYYHHLLLTRKKYTLLDLESKKFSYYGIYE